ncbi:MAG: tetratricopeptide repeat protein, partial [Nitrospirota bacterium]
MADTLDRNPGIGLVYGDQIITDTENETFERHTPSGNYRWIDYNRELLTIGCFIGPQPMWRKSLHDTFGYFDESFTVSGDWEFWLRIAEGTKMLHIRENLGLYYRSPQSAEHRDVGRRVGEDNRIVRTYTRKYLTSVGDVERGLSFVDEMEKLTVSRAYDHLREELLERKKVLLAEKAAAQDSLRLADELNQKGQVNDAVSALLAAIRQSADSRLHDALVDILIENKRFKEGFDILNNMPEEMRRSEKWYERLATCARELEQFEKAEQYADEAIKINGASTSAWNTKGFIAFKKGNRSEAERLFEKAIEADKGFGEAYCNLAGLRWLAGKKEEAVALFEKAFIISPTVPDVALSYYTIAATLKQFGRAAELFKEATLLHPLNKKLKFTLIDILLQQGDYHRAMKETEEAMAAFGIDDHTLSLALGIREKIGAMKIQGSRGQGSKESNENLEGSRVQGFEGSSEKEQKSVHLDPGILGPSAPRTLSLCMIVKNEENNIARCLTSVKPVVDEMIVVDTGSTDRTRDIAKAFGAQVYDFAWTESFADARNFSLSKASGDWILVLDADEVISPLDYEKLRELVKDPAVADTSASKDTQPSFPDLIGESSPFFLDTPVKPEYDKLTKLCRHTNDLISKAYSFVTRNYQDSIRLGWVENDGSYPKEETGAGWVPSVKVRLFPNRPGVRFENPVHEFVESSLSALGIEIVPCDIPVHHYGKLNEAQTASRAEYYYILGKRKLAEKGEGDLQTLYEIAVQATELEKYEEALEYWRKVCELKPDFADAILMLADTYNSLGRREEAVAAAKKALSLNPDSREIKASYAKYEILQGNPENAIEILKSLVQANRSYPKALAFLAAAYLCQGSRGQGFKDSSEERQGSRGGGVEGPSEEAKRQGLYYLELLNKTGFHASDFLTDFAKKLMAANKPAFALALLQTAIEHHYETDETRGMLEQIKRAGSRG